MTSKIDYIPKGNRKIERPSGLLAITISLLSICAILTQLDIKPDFVNAYDDMSFLGENLRRLNINTYIWLVNSILIIILGPSVLITFLQYGRSSSYLAAFLISSTGVIYLLYSGIGYGLIFSVKEYLKSPEDEIEYLLPVFLNQLVIKTNLQIIAYTLTGISTLILGQLIARTGYLPRFIGWMAISGGLIYTLFGWINLESMIFTAGRIIFLLSLMIFGIYLLLRGTINKKGNAVAE